MQNRWKEVIPLKWKQYKSCYSLKLKTTHTTSKINTDTYEKPKCIILIQTDAQIQFDVITGRMLILNHFDWSCGFANAIRCNGEARIIIYMLLLFRNLQTCQRFINLCNKKSCSTVLQRNDRNMNNQLQTRKVQHRFEHITSGNINMQPTIH